MKNSILASFLLVFLILLNTACDKEIEDKSDLNSISEIQYFEGNTSPFNIINENNRLSITDSTSIATKWTFDFSGNPNVISCQEPQNNFASFTSLFDVSDLEGIQPRGTSQLPIESDYINIIRSNESQLYEVLLDQLNDQEQRFYDKLREEYDSFDYCQ